MERAGGGARWGAQTKDEEASEAGDRKGGLITQTFNSSKETETNSERER